MTKSRIVLLFLLLVCLLAQAATKPKAKPQPAAASPEESMARKLAYVKANGAKEKPDPAPTVLTEGEVNAWFASKYAKLPAGVKSLHLEGTNGRVTARLRVDFDELKAGRTASNPLLGIFSGVHEAVVTGRARGEGGTGIVQTDSLSLDGVEIPRFILELFVEKFITPRYPNVGMESRFKMPSRITTAKIGDHQVTLWQK